MSKSAEVPAPTEPMLMRRQETRKLVKQVIIESEKCFGEYQEDDEPEVGSYFKFRSVGDT